MRTNPDLSAATAFVWRTARLLDRLRFAYLFLTGQRDPVLSALRAYRNPDGGFGNALEPDFRGPVSQPVTVASALEILDGVDALGDPMVGPALDFLSTVTAPDGGLPFVLPSVGDYPRAPWWEPQGDDPPGSLFPTATIAALLHKHRVDHAWLDAATGFCLRRIESVGSTDPYEMRAILPFLDHAPDRPRAEEAFSRIGPKIFEQELVALDPEAPGEVHTPLDFAPYPESLARRLFEDEVIELHLDTLSAAQQEDGGWTFNWPEWNQATTLEWRGFTTVRALSTLRAYGRLP
jgi:hypothetical protein